MVQRGFNGVVRFARKRASANVSGWANLELMGHRSLAGTLSVVDIAGGCFIRIDLAGTQDGTDATQFYSPSGIYCITPTTEEIAVSIGHNASMPVSRWELRQPVAQIHATTTREDDPAELWEDHEARESDGSETFTDCAYCSGEGTVPVRDDADRHL